MLLHSCQRCQLLTTTPTFPILSILTLNKFNNLNCNFRRLNHQHQSTKMINHFKPQNKAKIENRTRKAKVEMTRRRTLKLKTLQINRQQIRINNKCQKPSSGFRRSNKRQHDNLRVHTIRSILLDTLKVESKPETA